jgi:predicted TIM-barrel fold metal-dependent hydrolase
MRIIDSHCHIYPEKIARKAAENIGRFYGYPVPDFAAELASAPPGFPLSAEPLAEAAATPEPGSLDTMLRIGTDAGIDTFVVSGAATSPKQVTSVNDYFIDLAANQQSAKTFGKTLICYGTMHPDYNDIQGELQRCKNSGLRALKLHADCQAFNIDAPGAYNIYEAAQSLDLPILMHLGDETHDYSAPYRLVKVCKDFPHLRFIGAHLGGYRDWDNALLLKGIDNMWFDSSSSQSILEPERVVRQIRTFGANRVFFGTDYPLWIAKNELNAFLALPLSDAEKEGILSLNYSNFIGA